MIVDKLENISVYNNIPECVVDFINSIDVNIPLGKHILSENIYANVEKYKTKPIENVKFESHKDYIDIQFLLSGNENIYTAYIQNLNVSIPYDKKKDIMFYSDSVENAPKVVLNGTNFVMLFPHEAHAPQAAINEQEEEVLKVVVKIKI